MTDTNEQEQPLKIRCESIDIEALSESLHDLSGEGHDIVLRSESIDILTSSLDSIVKNGAPSSSILPVQLYKKESDASALMKIVGLRKESDASALYSLTSMRKDSDASALSALVKDEEEMMQHDEDKISYNDKESFEGRETPMSIRKTSDPFENLRKLSDASDAVSALRKLSEGSDPLKSFRKESDGTLEDESLGDFKSPESAVNILGEMKMTKDDASVHLFENNPELPKVEPNSVFKHNAAKYTSSALEHLDILGSDKNSDDGSSSSTVTMNEANQKLLMDALLGPSRRNRAESWGGMSDISANQMARIESLASAADISTADIPRGPSPHGFEGVIMSPRSQSQDSLTGHLQQVEDKKRRRRSSSIDRDLTDRISVPLIKGRERLDSLSGLIIPMPKGGRERAGSFSRDRLDSWSVRDRKDSITTRDRLDSLANLSGIFSKGRDRLDSLASLGEVSLTMSLGDLEDVAGKLESIVHGDESDVGDSSSEVTSQPSSKASKGDLPAPTIQVDSEAVQSAVQAAMAATSGGILDMLQINTPSKGTGKMTKVNSSHNAPTPLISNAKIKVSAANSTAECKMEEIRARARAAAGYVHPGTEAAKISSKSKKRPLSSSNSTAKRPKPTQFSTPLALPKLAKSGRVPCGAHIYGDYSTTTPKRKSNNSKSSSSSSKGGQSNQKWEEMFECLVTYVKEQNAKDTSGMSEQDAKKWEWSGNVPTMYKTKNGKALGRWINNQRSAKSKGSLKPEREQRLVSTGLKWSVLTTNAWTDMMEELKVYVKEKTKDGKNWDGNVPTNYKIKNNGRPDGSEIDDEDKNLGRWINRQRSLYQAGKLKDDRRKQLEAIGLKWAVLSTTSWHTMHEALCRYAISKREADKNKYWDGNVPASYETDDKPPKKLGRWVNRQRSAYANKKLKKEFVEKLEKAGLKWTAMDSKKDLENSEVLIRQRSLVQVQRPIIQRIHPQISRPSLPGLRPAVPGIRPAVSTSKSNVFISGGRPITQGTKPNQQSQLPSRPTIQPPNSISRPVPTTVKSSTADKTTYKLLLPRTVVSAGKHNIEHKVAMPTKISTQKKPGAIIVGSMATVVRAPSTATTTPLASKTIPRIMVHGRTMVPLKPQTLSGPLKATAAPPIRVPKGTFPQIKAPLQITRAKVYAQSTTRPNALTAATKPAIIRKDLIAAKVAVGVKKEVTEIMKTTAVSATTGSNGFPQPQTINLIKAAVETIGIKKDVKHMKMAVASATRTTGVIGNGVRVHKTVNSAKKTVPTLGIKQNIKQMQTTAASTAIGVIGNGIPPSKVINSTKSAVLTSTSFKTSSPLVMKASTSAVVVQQVQNIKPTKSTSCPAHNLTLSRPVLIASVSKSQIPTKVATFIPKVSSSISPKSGSGATTQVPAVTTAASPSASITKI